MNTDLLVAGGAVDVRAGDPQHDGIDGVVPGIIVEPHSAAAVATTLAWASEQRLSVVIRGGGTKIEWGRTPGRVDAIVSMRRLNRVLTHRQGDLTATVEAGITLGELNQVLAAHGQQLPLDPPFADRATIGGLLATNDSGPARHRFGTPRDLVIGVQVATTDGRLAKAGGQVVKNVAGYDLSKLMSGSFGTLAAIVSATFKLSPLSSASSTLLIDRANAAVLEQIATVMAAGQLEPMAFEFHAARDGTRMRASCLLRFAALGTVVDAQVREGSARVAAIHPSCDVVTGVDEANLWREHSARIWRAPGAVARVSWLPADIAKAVDTLAAIRGLAEAIGRVALGAGLVRVEGETGVQAAAIEALRESKTFANVVLVRASPALKTAVDVWGSVPNRPLMESLKRSLDPNGTLGAGRGPI